MKGQFKVGEVLVGQNYTIRTSRNGMECEVIAPLMLRQWHFDGEVPAGSGFVYEVRWADGHVNAAFPKNLRRKQPPAGEQSILRMLTQPMPKKELA